MLVVLLLLRQAVAWAEVSPVFASHLTCEYLEDPLGIDSPTPRLSWIVEDPEYTRGQYQSAYEIIVAGKRTMLDQDRGDLWESGIVNSDQSVLVPYAGKVLKPNLDCYWKVRVYDMSCEPGAWSDVGRFTVGPLEKTDWKGVWIHHPTAPDEAQIWYRKSFQLEATGVDRAFAHIASIGYHECYINGKRVDDRVLAPALSRIDKRVLYVTYDVADYLTPGENVIAIWYGPGWARNEFFSQKTGPALLAQLDVISQDGSTDSIVSGEDWKCKPSNRSNTGSNRYKHQGAEYVDGSAYEKDWNRVGYNDESWVKAQSVVRNVQLSAHNLPPTRVIKRLQPVAVTSVDSKTKYFDMGINFTGFLKVEFEGMDSGDEVKIMVADGPDAYQDWEQCNIYKCSGGESDTFENRFNYVAGRYVTVQGVNKGPGVKSLVAEVIATDLKQTGEFSCSKALFNEIYETDLWTYRMCTTEGFTADCPHRERLGYGEVGFATAWAIGYPFYDVGAFYNKIVRDWEDVQEEDGWIHHTAPQWNNHYGGPMWSSAGLNIAWEHYLQFADTRLLKEHYDSYQRWLSFLHRHSQSGLLEAFFGGGKFLGDWAAPGGRKEFGGTPEATYFNNCVYAMILEKMIGIAEILGNRKDIEIYTERLNFLKFRITETYYQPEFGCYMNGNQVQSAFPVLADIVSDSNRTAILEDFRKKIEADDAYLDMGSSGLPVLLKFLTEEVPFDEAMSRILSKVDQPSYGFFLKKGETTWPEYWSSDVDSRIHTCYTGISSWMMKRVAGIRADPQTPGYRSILLEPAILEDMEYARGTTRSPFGTIESSWRKTEGDTLRIFFRIPTGCHAKAWLPHNGPEEVLEDGQSLKDVDGVVILKSSAKGTLVELLSGQYHFEMPLVE